jgi:hypothetical protein
VFHRIGIWEITAILGFVLASGVSDDERFWLIRRGCSLSHANSDGWMLQIHKNE